MVKTTIYLPEDLKRRLEKSAARSGASEAEVIRTAVERLLDTESPPRPTLPLFRSGDPRLAERTEELLRESFGE
jgi:Arc/MetJ-type ribon-helix-helix transcriptional regulator